VFLQLPHPFPQSLNLRPGGFEVVFERIGGGGDLQFRADGFDAEADSADGFAVGGEGQLCLDVSPMRFRCVRRDAELVGG